MTSLLSSTHRPIMHSHFQVTWRQNQVTGLMTLLAEPVSASSVTYTHSDDSDEDDRDADTIGTASVKAEKRPLQNWRNKERMRTMGVAIALCLNLGTDPPDSDKVAPCARTECGIDPSRYHIDAPAYAVLKMIGTQLELQFRTLQPRANIKLAADPTVDMIRKTCTSLRKIAKAERVLMHFNGHGVPKPTRNGEIWAFNDDFTQYIPLSVFDLIRWTGHPAIFTFDCQAAGQLIPHFLSHEQDNEHRYKQQLDEWRRNRAKRRKEQERRDRRERENERLVRMARAQNSVLLATAASALASATSEANNGEGGETSQGGAAQGSEEDARPVRKRIIVLVPCGADESLPSSPLLPADLFTCCLTTPIQTALRWFISQNRMTMEPLGIEQGMVNLISGKSTERKTMLGELNWIFTAVTDTIAWTVLPQKLFQRLFRQDLLVSSMLRHFLLAERIFRNLGCTPQSIPALPSTWKHRMWDAWDQAVEHCLVQLLTLIPPKVLAENGFHRAARIATERQASASIPKVVVSMNADGQNENHVESRFFKDQLQAFEVWLSQPSSSAAFRQGTNLIAPPEQLPVVLQVLLSHQHRLVALDQLARFVDLGTWAVSHALSVGIFPYVLKLLQSSDVLKPYLVRIWVRILDVDPSCREDLNQAHGYFVKQLTPAEEPEHAARAALVLCICCDGDSQAKAKCLASDLDKACLSLVQIGSQFEAEASGVGRDVGARHQPYSSESESDSESEERPSPRLITHRQELVANSPRKSYASADGSSTGPDSYVARDVNLVRWCCLLLARLWDGFEQGRARAFNFKISRALERLLVEDEHAGVREASAYALGRLLGPLYVDQPLAPSPSPPAGNGPSVSHAGAGDKKQPPREEKAKNQELCDAECDLAVRLLKAGRQDGSPLVRREIVLAVSRFVTDSAHLGNFQLTVHFLSEFRQKSTQTQPALIDKLHSTFGARGPKYMAIWLDLTRVFAVDPFPAVSQTAQILIRFVKGGVDARIDAIRGRAGEGYAPPNSFLSGAGVTPDGGNTLPPVPTVFLESDLFERSKRKLCRTRQDLEEDVLSEETMLESQHRRLLERARAASAWSLECSYWISCRQSAEWWYTDDTLDLEADDSFDPIPRNLKAPFLQLLRSQRNTGDALPHNSHSGQTALSSGATALNGISHGAGDSHVVRGSSGALEVSVGSSGIGMNDSEHELVRRFDGLPADLFSSSVSTRPLRRSTSFQSQLFRQSSLSLPSLGAGNPSQAQSQQGSNRFLLRGADRSPSGGHRLDEVYRVDLSKHGIGGAAPFLAVYHPFAPNLLVAHQQTISCFDYSLAGKIGPQVVSKFSNLNIAATMVSSMTWVDANTEPLLLTYSDDGHVRVWRDPTVQGTQLVSAFSPFDLAAGGAPVSTSGSDKRGMHLVEWVPQCSQLICTTAVSPALRVWDLVTEKLISELICPGPGESAIPSVTALSSSDHSTIFCASFTEGVARVLDRRSNGKFSSILLRASTSSSEPIVGLSKLSANNCLATVSESGEVKIWDVRMESAVSFVSGFRAEGGDCIYSFHPNAPLLACAQRKALPGVVKVLTFDDVELAHIKLKAPTSGASTFGFMAASKPVRQVCSLAWHPQELSLTVGNADYLTTYVAPNTRLRGAWSPQDMKVVAMTSISTAQQSSAATVLTAAHSHNSGSSISVA